MDSSEFKVSDSEQQLLEQTINKVFGYNSAFAIERETVSFQKQNRKNINKFYKHKNIDAIGLKTDQRCASSKALCEKKASILKDRIDFSKSSSGTASPCSFISMHAPSECLQWNTKKGKFLYTKDNKKYNNDKPDINQAEGFEWNSNGNPSNKYRTVSSPVTPVSPCPNSPVSFNGVSMDTTQSSTASLCSSVCTTIIENTQYPQSSLYKCEKPKKSEETDWKSNMFLTTKPVLTKEEIEQETCVPPEINELVSDDSEPFSTDHIEIPMSIINLKDLPVEVLFSSDCSVYKSFCNFVEEHLDESDTDEENLESILSDPD